MKMTGKIRSTALAVTVMAAAVPALLSSADAAWGWRGHELEFGRLQHGKIFPS